MAKKDRLENAIRGRFELLEHDTNPFHGRTAAGLALEQNCMP